MGLKTSVIHVDVPNQQNYIIQNPVIIISCHVFPSYTNRFPHVIFIVQHSPALFIYSATTLIYCTWKQLKCTQKVGALKQELNQAAVSAEQSALKSSERLNVLEKGCFFSFSQTRMKNTFVAVWKTCFPTVTTKMDTWSQ